MSLGLDNIDREKLLAPDLLSSEVKVYTFYLVMIWQGHQYLLQNKTNSLHFNLQILISLLDLRQQNDVVKESKGDEKTASVGLCISFGSIPATLTTCKENRRHKKILRDSTSTTVCSWVHNSFKYFVPDYNACCLIVYFQI